MLQQLTIKLVSSIKVILGLTDVLFSDQQNATFFFLNFVYFTADIRCLAKFTCYKNAVKLCRVCYVLYYLIEY